MGNPRKEDRRPTPFPVTPFEFLDSAAPGAEARKFSDWGLDLFVMCVFRRPTCKITSQGKGNTARRRKILLSVLQSYLRSLQTQTPQSRDAAGRALAPGHCSHPAVTSCIGDSFQPALNPTSPWPMLKVQHPGGMVWGTVTIVSC